MKSTLLAAAVAAAIAGVAGRIPAHATPTTYTYDANTGFTFASGSTANLSGTFTIDPPGDSLSSGNVTVTGGPFADIFGPIETFDTPIGLGLGYQGLGVFTHSLLLIFFTPDLGTSPAPQHPLLSQVLFLLDSTLTFGASAVAGGAQLQVAAAPEPESWTIVLSGMLGLFVVRRLRHG
jgi:hypothetical protein